MHIIKLKGLFEFEIENIRIKRGDLSFLERALFKK